LQTEEESYRCSRECHLLGSAGTTRQRCGARRSDRV